MNKTFDKYILVTGGAGFIGSHLLHHMVKKYPNYFFINFDKLTYAGNLANLRSVQSEENYTFRKGDIVIPEDISAVFESFPIDSVIHLAAESHVDRSIENPLEFVYTNVIGTVNLLNACRTKWEHPYDKNLFYHVSTDEVYGSLGDTGLFTEETSYDPRSPYSASKASSDHFVRAYHETYDLPVKLSNCSNNYGPYQFPEKLLPLFIEKILNKEPLPVYGDGKYTRDWLWVEDHANAIDVIFHEGKTGDTYNIGGFNEWKNIDLIKKMCEVMDKKLDRPAGSAERLITFVKDRAGHDRRYAIDAGKLNKELKWEPSLQFEEGLEKTIDWYLANAQWMEDVKSGAYLQYNEAQLMDN